MYMYREQHSSHQPHLAKPHARNTSLQKFEVKLVQLSRFHVSLYTSLRSTCVPVYQQILDTLYQYQYVYPGGKSAASFFKVLANAVDSLGRIPLWYYWQNIVPEFLTVIDIGNCLTHQNFFRTLNRREYPQRRRIIDSNARVVYPSSVIK